MTSKKIKHFLTALIIVTSLLLSANLAAQSETKLKPASDTTGLEEFLIVKHDYIKIPITKMASGHLHIKVVLNGVDGDFILDTGAGATVVETNRVNKFSLKTADTKNSGAGGTQTLQKATNNIFKLGVLVKTEFDVYVMNLDHVNKAPSSMGLKEVDGIIGADIFTENKAIIDYANLILYLRK